MSVTPNQNGLGGVVSTPEPLEAKLLRSLTPMATVSRTRSDKQRKPAQGTCRLILRINGTSYTVRPVLADSSVALKAFRLRKADGTLYDVAHTVHGHQCDCPDFLFHRDGIDPDGCKHIKALVACGLLDAKGGAR